MFISLILSIFIHNHYLFIITFTFYYIIDPYFKAEKTLSSKFLNVRLEFSKYRLIKIALRIVFIYAYYIGSLFIIIASMLFIKERLNVEFSESFWLYVLSMIGIFLFYLINILVLIKNKKIYYDNFFQVKYISTIKMENSNENTK